MNTIKIKPATLKSECNRALAAADNYVLSWWDRSYQRYLDSHDQKTTFFFKKDPADTLSQHKSAVRRNRSLVWTSPEMFVRGDKGALKRLLRMCSMIQGKKIKLSTDEYDVVQRWKNA